VNARQQLTSNITFIKLFLLSKTKGKLLVFLLNIFTDKKLKFRFYDGKYLLLEKGISKYFIKNRAHLYLKGAADRSTRLANKYGLYLLKFMPGDVIVDVGANNGDLLPYFKNQIYIGFEPSPDEFELLDANSKFYSAANVHNYCIGNSNSDVLFYISSAGADSSIFEPVTFTNRIKVQQIRLDEFFDRIKIKLLKIDAEGAELEVLQGSQNILDCIEFISVDAGFEKGINAKLTAPEVFDFLYLNGFHLINEASYTRYLFKNSLLINN
jgi:FkbM family methyltransferase